MYVHLKHWKQTVNVTAISGVKYIWRLNENPRGRRWELNSHGAQGSPWGVFTHPGQLNHVPLPLFCWMLPEQGCPLQLMILSCSCGYLLSSGEHRKEQHCLDPSVLELPLCGKQGVMTVCWGGSWALGSPLTPGWLLSQQGELPAITHMLWPKQRCPLTFKILIRRKLVSCLVFVLINVLFSYSLVTTINS